MLTLFGLIVLIAPFVNNTAVVAIFIPIVIAASLKVGLAPSKTLIPLSVAFIDEAGAIINIADMQPHDERSH